MHCNNNLMVLIFVLILIYLIYQNSKETFSNSKDVCRGYLSDKEYLEHMIPHHQVAIDISIELQKTTKSTVMKDILRKLIFNQKMEIILMKAMLSKPAINVTYGSSKGYLVNRADKVKPNVLGLTKTFCDPHFFDSEGHMEHMKHMKLNDKTYLEHMIPHHQVAVDMSKVLLNNTKNDFMLYLAYRIIRNQTAEIIYLDTLLKKSINLSGSQMNNLNF